MTEDPSEEQSKLWLAEEWMANRKRLHGLLSSRMSPILQQRVAVEDMLQECYLACGRRMDFIIAQPDIPIYVKFRRISLQTLTDMERHHLGAAKRDAMKEVQIDGSGNEANMDAWERFADTMTSPLTRMLKLERQAMTRRVMEELSDGDRQILELRHFEDMSNAECAAELEITSKAASIRYVRALKRFQELIMQFSMFQS